MEAEHRQHAVVELCIRDLKDQALAHFPSGDYNANAAWTVIACLAHNLGRWTTQLGLSDPTGRRDDAPATARPPRPPDPPCDDRPSIRASSAELGCPKTPRARARTPPATPPRRPRPANVSTTLHLAPNPSDPTTRPSPAETNGEIEA